MQTLFKNAAKLSLRPQFKMQLSASARGEAKSAPRILITGGHGQLGGSLARLLRTTYGPNSVLLTDIVKPSEQILSLGTHHTKSAVHHENGNYKYLDILNESHLSQIIVDERIDWIIHFSALLSAIAEHNVQRAIDINVTGLLNILQLATKYKCRVFVPSTIGAFGPDSPLEFTPNSCIQRPNTIYGVTKVFCELLGEYFNKRYGLDFRCLRLPGVISADSQPGGGTTDYAVDVFHHVFKSGRYECYLRPDTSLPMIYIDDCVRGILEFMQVDPHTLKRRVYNIAAVSFNPEELFAEIKKKYPKAEFAYKPDQRQKIADSWPKVLDDSLARSEWNWRPNFGIKELVEVMFDYLERQKR